MTHPLAEIKTFPSLVKYLRDQLDWPIESDDFEELTFDFEPHELGLKAEYVDKIGDSKIKQLRRLTSDQPWGVFFVDFKPKRLPVVALRKILGSLVVKKRISATRSERASWQLHDLLFIVAYGDSGNRQLTLAHFSDSSANDSTPPLKVIDWDEFDTGLKIQHVDAELHKKLRWPADGESLDNWRSRWSGAFTLRHRHVIKTAQELAEQLADLAKAIRQRARRVLDIETDRGRLKKLYAAFQEALIHDLSEDDFADMYAQTITYGLFSAAVSPKSNGAGSSIGPTSVVELVPVTNPFLREMLATFLTAGGRKGKLDFDELGIQVVVEVLNSPDTHLNEVVRDFGNRGKGEDPVIHFYEDFLREYDNKRKVQRGVFYTPQPVVSYIVRSVHELLKTEFGLEDGLASTITWGEFVSQAQRESEEKVSQASQALGQRSENAKSERPNPKSQIRIPAGTAPDSPFVTILDPATGTATFLVEVIDLIHKTMTAKWSAQGLSKQQKLDAWNEYVPKHLLPRLFGYELMMAPYAIAHMKIGLKLAETGYKFGSSERARIYLTNALERPHEEQQETLQDWFPALAHEAAAVNKVKRDQRFMVVIGNPPYAGVSSNMSEYAQQLVDAYKLVDGEALNERKLWLQDDYVKFIRNAQTTIDRTGVGVFGYITNHGYIDNPTFRGMRQSLMETFPQLRILDLHGNANKKEQSPDGSEDKNVFDIRQGVAICLATRGGSEASVKHGNLWGSRESKYAWLAKHRVNDTGFSSLTPDSPFYFFEPQNTDCREEYDAGWKVTDIFPINGVGVVMARDSMTVDFDADALWKRVKDFATLPPERARTKYELGKDARDWRVATAQADVQASGPTKKKICAILYRPFDERFTYYTGNSRGFYASPCRKVMSNMAQGDNLGIALARSVEIGKFEHVFCTRGIIGHHSVSLKEVNYLFPLWLVRTNDAPKTLLKDEGERQPNLSVRFRSALATALSLKTTGAHGLPPDLTPEDILNYAYAVFHSPAYRQRYAEFLKIDFPRIPLTGSVALFRSLAKLGSELVALHVMEAPKLDKHLTTYVGPANFEVEKISWAKNTVWLDKKQARGFRGVPEDVWNFRIGGYQVCEKWLKDRKGRTLSQDDLDHYHRIVVALAETIRLMAEIDRAIEAHGGWPGAFQREPVAKTSE